MPSVDRSKSQHTCESIGKSPVWVVMGVSGAGKSSIASLLAKQKGYLFIEGDALHPTENIDAMRAGKPLTDAMRMPWLTDIAQTVQQQQEMSLPGIIVSCSALKLAYRDFFRSQIPGVQFIYLKVSRAVLAERLQSREGHFMSDQLLDSQLSTLELFDHETDLYVVDAELPTDGVVAALLPRMK